jgi:hypothetical protein
MNSQRCARSWSRASPACEARLREHSLLQGPYTTFPEPHTDLHAKYSPDQPKNQGHVSDAIVNDLLHGQSRTLDVTRRRAMIHEMPRHLAKEQYYVEPPSPYPLPRGGRGNHIESLAPGGGEGRVRGSD